MIEIRFRNLVHEIGRHRRQLRDEPLLDAFLVHANFLALVVGEDDDLTLLAKDEARNCLTVRQIQRRGPEGLIDVAIRVEDVFEQPIHAADADTIELGANLGALIGDLMAGSAVLLEDLGPLRGIDLGVEVLDCGLERGVRLFKVRERVLEIGIVDIPILLFFRKAYSPPLRV